MDRQWKPLKSTIKQKKHNHEKTPYVGILPSCPKINNNASTNIQNHNLESPIQQMLFRQLTKDLMFRQILGSLGI